MARLTPHTPTPLPLILHIGYNMRVDTLARIKLKIDDNRRQQQEAELARALLLAGKSKRDVVRLLRPHNKRVEIVDKVSADLGLPRGQIGWLRAYRANPTLALRALRAAAERDYHTANIILTALIDRQLSIRGWQRTVARYRHLLADPADPAQG